MTSFLRAALMSLFNKTIGESESAGYEVLATVLNSTYQTGEVTGRRQKRVLDPLELQTTVSHHGITYWVKPEVRVPPDFMSSRGIQQTLCNRVTSVGDDAPES
ncbi:hypothetical protein STEG23_006070 [Scotinomys teguina]